MTSHILSEDSAEGLLNPHLSTFKIIMLESLEALNKAIGASGESINNRAKCSFFHSVAIEKAKKYFKDCKDVIIKTKYQSIQIVFSEKIVGRFKKVNKHDLTANAKTKRNQLIVTHQLSLYPDMKPMTFVDIAYKIDPTWTDFEKLLVVCRLYDDVKWRIPYTEVANLVTPVTQQETLTVKEEKQIKIKKAK